MRSVKRLKEEAERLESFVAATDRKAEAEKSKLKSFINKVRKELHLGEFG